MTLLILNTSGEFIPNEALGRIFLRPLNEVGGKKWVRKLEWSFFGNI
jgi:hypothetical protein